VSLSFTQGYIQIYTGDGKGKTTAALGLALRAAGHGLRSYIAQFMKGQSYGELVSLRSIPEITIEQFGKDTFIHIDRATPEDIQMAEYGLKQARKAMTSGNYQIIMLDEILVAIHFKLLPLNQVLNFLTAKPPIIELVLTGRNAPKELIDKADLVTEMVEVKHYYHHNVPARDGIER
jgi:cob(I)alamin adenosyltransferase